MIIFERDFLAKIAYLNGYGNVYEKTTKISGNIKAFNWFVNDSVLSEFATAYFFQKTANRFSISEGPMIEFLSEQSNEIKIAAEKSLKELLERSETATISLLSEDIESAKSYIDFHAKNTNILLLGKDDGKSRYLFQVKCSPASMKNLISLDDVDVYL